MTDLVQIQNNRVVVSSKQVAKRFNKEHKNVLATIKDILVAGKSATNFYEETSFDYRGRKFPMYLMDKDGFSLLVMGFTGKEALEWKIKYIKAFNEMEQQLTNQHYTDEEVKQLADEYYYYKMEALRGYLIRGYLQAKIIENNKIVPDDVNTIMRFIRTNLSSKCPSRCVFKDF